MKKLLCFAMVLYLAVCGLYAQTPCIRFVQPNLYPEPGVTQSINIYFNNAGLTNDGKYAITYDLYRNGEPLSDVEIGSFLNLAQTAILVPLTTNANYNGQLVTTASGIFPSGYFEAGGNISQYNFNYLNGAYLNAQNVHIQIKLAWRSDRTYTDDTYMLVIGLVSMSGGMPQENINYNMRDAQLGGYGASVGATLFSDTITTIKYVDEVIKDTICYSQLPYTLGRTTIRVGDGDIQTPGSAFYSIVTEEVTFGKPLNDLHCNERIDSIATVKFYVRPELTLTNVGTGNNLIICDYSTAGYVRVQPTGGNAPYTVYAYKNDNGTYETTATGSVTINTSEGIDTIKGLGVGNYKLVCVDAAGCEAEVADEAVITAADNPNTYTITGTITHIICNGGETGKIESVNAALNAGGTEAAPLTYSWTGPDEYSNNGQAITGLKAGTYTVTVTDLRGCISAQPFTVNENAAIETTDAVSRCASQLPYQHGDTIFSLDEVVNGQIQKVVHFTSVQGCDSAVTVTLTVHENPTVNWGNTPSSVCEGQPLHATVDVSTFESTSNFHWTQDDVTLPNATSNSEEITWSAAGTKTISVNFSDANGCRVVSDTVKNITVNPLPSTTVTTQVNGVDSTMNITACAGQTVTLTAANNASYQYVWKKGEGTVGDQQTLTLSSISAGEAGSYVVEITDTSAALGTNCSATSETVDISVNTPDVTLASTEIELDNICLGNSQSLGVTVAEQSESGRLSYKWSTDETAATITVSPTSAGDKTYTVTVTDSIGMCAATATATITFTVNDTVQLTFADGVESNPVICLGNSFTDITVNASNCTLSIDWNNTNYEGVSFNNTTGTISGAPTHAGPIQYTITATSTNGCGSKTLTGTITVNDTVQLGRTSDSGDTTQTICLGNDINTIQFSVTNAELSCTWASAHTGLDFGNNSIFGAPTPAGIYKYTVTASSDNNCASSNKTITGTITVNDTVKLAFHEGANANPTICLGEAISIQIDTANCQPVTVTGLSTGLSYANGFITGTPTVAGEYNYSINAVNDCGEKTISGKITVNDTITLTITGGDTTQNFCLGNPIEEIIFTVGNASTVTCSWAEDHEPVSTFGSTGIYGTPANAGIYKYTFSATSTNCPSSNKTITGTITVKDTVVLAFRNGADGANPIICLGEAAINIQIDTANCQPVTVTGLSYGLSYANGFITGTPTVATEYNYSIHAVSNNGCGEKTISGTIIVNDTVKLAFHEGANANPTICLGEAISIQIDTANCQPVTVTGLSNGLSYANGFITGTPTVATEYNYSVTAVNANGCGEKTISGKITVKDTVSLTITGDTTQTICLGSDIDDIQFSVENATLSCTWAGDHAGLVFGNNSIFGTPTPAGIYKYTVTAASNNNCASSNKTITGTITVNDTVQYSLTGGLNQKLCWEDMGDTVKVTNIKNANITTNADDNLGVLSGTDYVKIFRTANTPADDEEYGFSITLTSNNNCTSTNKTITGGFTVYDTVSYTITSGDTTFATCIGSAITPIKITCTNGFIEDNDVTGIPTGLEFTYSEGIYGTPTTAGVFHYTVTIHNQQSTDEGPCAGKTITGTITVNDTVKLAIENKTQEICLGESIEPIAVIYDNATISGLSSLATGLSITTADGKDTITGAPTLANVYEYTVVAASNNGCTTTNKEMKISITVKDTARVWFASANSKQAVCLNQPIADITVDSANCTLSASGLPAGVVLADGKISGTPTEAGTFVYTIMADPTNFTDHNECGGMSISDTLIVNALPSVTISGTIESAEMCAGIVDTLTANATLGTAPYTYAWNNSINTQKNPVNATGEYTVTVTDANTCTATDSYEVTVHPLPSVTISTETPTTVCKGTEVTIIASAAAEPSVAIYYWKKDGVTVRDGANASTYTFTANGDSTYQVVVRSEFGCTDTATYTGTIYNLPEIAIDEQTNIDCKGENTGSVTLKITNGTPVYSYNWTGPDNYTYTGGKTISNVYAGTYAVTVTDAHTCTAVKNDIVVTEPENALTFATITIDSVKCFNGNDGEIVLAVNGGTPFDGGKYQYRLSTESTGVMAVTRTISDLTAGTYQIIVADSKGCEITKDTAVGQPAAALAFASITVDSVKCYNENNGKITVEVTGGNGGYNYAWTGSTSSTNVADGLKADNYSVTVTDRKGCTISKDTVVGQPEVLAISVVAVDSVTCYSGNDGKIEISVTGGNGGYTYAWTNNVSDNNMAKDLTAGSYTVTVTDSKNCSVTKDTIVGRPEAALAFVSVTVDSVKCNNGNDGKITVEVTGGYGEYTYAWTNNISDNNVAKDLTAGSYSVTVTDRKGCTISKDTVVGQPAAALAFASIKVDSVDCFGLHTGKITVEVTGGNGGYNYAWTGSTSSTNVADNLEAGDYSVTVTDRKGCTISKDTVVGQPAAALAFVSVTVDSVKCYDGTDGKITVEVTGGNGGYTYEWVGSNSTTNVADELAAGDDYTITVIDRKGCEISKDTVVGQPEELTFASITVDSVTCYDGENGKITIEVTGGNGGYTYAWAGNTSTTNVADELKANNYSVTVTDRKNCTITKDTVVGQPTELTITITEVKNITCHDDNDGKITVTSAGGTGIRMYSWDNETTYSAIATKSRLEAGSYTIFVKDENACVTTITAEIMNPDPIVINETALTKSISCYGANDGVISVTVTGGTGDLHYYWSQNAGTGTYDTLRTDLAAGTYQLTVQDDNECSADITIELSQPEQFAVTISGEDSICAGTTTNFTATVVADNAYTYTLQWYKGNSTMTDSINATIHGIAEAGQYIVKATQGTSACEQSDTVTLTLLTVPTVTTTTARGLDAVCFGVLDTVKAHGADAYEWSDNTTNDWAEVPQTIGTHYFEVTGTNIYGTKSCSATAKDTVTVMPLPSATLTVGGTTKTADCTVDVCELSALTLSVPEQSGVSYKWFKGADVQVGTERELAFTAIAADNAGTYYAIVTNDATGCDSTSYMVTVNVLPLPHTTITALVDNDHYTNNLAVCKGKTVSLTAPASEGGDYVYTWKKDGNILGTAEVASNNYLIENINASNAGTYTVVVKNTTTGCDSTSLPFVIKVNELPVPQLAVQTNVICADSAFHFTVTSDTVISTYSWLRNNEPITGDAATLRATEAGTYSVNVVDHNGCTATTNEVVVTVNALPVVSIREDNNNTAICADSAFHFSLVSDTLLVSYKWMRDGDSINNTATIRDAGLTAAEYAYTATVVDKNNCKVTTDPLTVTVNALPVFTVNDPEVCQNGTVALSAINADLNYVWSPSDSLQNYTDGLATVTFKSRTAGTFNIVVTGTDNNACSATDTATITVNGLPTVGIPTLGGRDRICLNDTTKFDVGHDYATYTWTTTGGTFDSDDTRSVIFTGSTANNTTGHIVTVEVTDENNCTNSASKTIIVDTLPNVTIASADDACQSDTMTFTTQTGNGITGWNWTYTTDNAVYNNIADNTLKVVWNDNTEAVKTITVNYADANGCRAADDTTITVTIHPLPVVNITEGRDSSICKGSTIVLHATSTTLTVGFEWDNNLGTEPAVNVTPEVETTYVVTGTYTAASSLNCASTDTITVHLKDTVKLTVANAEQSKCLGQAIDDITVTYEAAILSWTPTTFADGLTATDVTNTVTIAGNITSAGIYTYEVTATSTNGCDPKTETITLTVNDTNKLAAMNPTLLTQEICLGEEIKAIVLDTANCTLNFEPALNTIGLAYNDADHQIEGTPVKGVHNVTITATPATDGCNAAKTLEFTITVNDTNKLAAVTPALLEQEICLGSDIEIIVLDTANCSLEFKLNDGTFSNDYAIGHGIFYSNAENQIIGTPDTVMTFNITIKAHNENGCNADKTLDITIKVNDTVKIAASTLTAEICKDAELPEMKMWATNGTIALGTGTTPAGLADTYSTTNDTIYLNGTLTAAGDYSFYVVATGTACTTSKDSLMITITVDTIPAVTLTPDAATICPNADLRYTDLTATTGYESYAWSTNETTTDNVLHVTPDAETEYTVTVTDGHNCTASASTTVSIYPMTVSTITGDNAICLGESTELTAVPDADFAAQDYEWIGISADNPVTVTPVTDSTFYVRVNYTHGCYDTAKIEVTVHTLPVVDLSPKSANVCQNGTLELSSANAESDITYLWKDATDSVFNERVFTFVPDTNTTAGIHKISVRLTDGNGCVNSDTAEVTVNVVPILTETHNRVRCYGESSAFIDLNVHFNGGTPASADNSYSWTDGDAFTSTDEDLIGLAKGTYSVTVTNGTCSADTNITIQQPDTMTAILSAPGHALCSGTMDLTATPEGGNGNYNYVWTSDNVTGTATTENTLQLDGATLTAGIHEYYVKVVDDSNCVTTAVIAAGSTDTIWTISSERLEVNRDINLGPDETYTHEGYTYGLSIDDNGKTFEVNAGAGSGGCDSVIIYTVHMYGIGMNFTDNTYDLERSSYFHNYSFHPNVTFDTINTSTDVDNEFYAYVTSLSDSIDGKHVDMKYEILFNDNPISNDEFEDYVTNLKMSSFYDHDGRFYGIPHIDSARGEMPATTFLFQFPSNSTPYYFDYFNFGAFRNMPQKIEFNFAEAGVYTIKFTVEERVNSTTGNWWGLYNPSVVNSGRGPVWGGRNDEFDGKQTITARNMTVIVGGAGSTTSNPIVTSIDNYTNNTVPTLTTYPNPARDLLNLNISGMEGNTRITITDATGKLVAVYNENLTGSESTLTYDIAKFSQGIYFLNVYNNETILTNKFIVTK